MAPYRARHRIRRPPPPVKGVKTSLTSARKRAGVTDKFAGSHSLRKSAAAWLADKSVDMRQIQKLLGHEAIETTEQIYAGQSAGYLVPAVTLLSEAVGANISEGGSPATRAQKRAKKGVES